jgi:hypothetical protein
VTRVRLNNGHEIDMTLTSWVSLRCAWEDQSQRETAAQVSAGKTEIIELDGVPIGIQLVNRFESHIELEQLYIAKAYPGESL